MRLIVVLSVGLMTLGAVVLLSGPAVPARGVGGRVARPDALQAARVVVLRKGWGEQPDGQGSTCYSYGVVLRNTSKRLDALDVTVHVEVAARGYWGVIDEIQPTLTVIPAGQTFYLGSQGEIEGTPPIAVLRVTVGVGRTMPRQIVLPPVSNPRLDPAHQRVTALMTNPYNDSIKIDDAALYLVVFDHHGRVIGGSDTGQIGTLASAAVRSGARATVSFPLTGFPPARAAYARISIDPH